MTVYSLFLDKSNLRGLERQKYRVVRRFKKKRPENSSGQGIATGPLHDLVCILVRAKIIS